MLENGLHKYGPAKELPVTESNGAERAPLDPPASGWKRFLSLTLLRLQPLQ